jgi:DNA-binding NarL/FixJ family response regulator
LQSPGPAGVPEDEGEAMTADKEGRGKAPAAGAAGRRRVLLVDDHPIVRKGLRRLIENDPQLEVCAEAEGVRDARGAIRQHRPDVVVVDISLKDGDGIELVKEVRAHHPDLPLLVLSMHEESVYAERLLAAGANGYIMKEAASAQLVGALHTVLAGGRYVSDAIGARLLRRAVADEVARGSGQIDSLSNRELQILVMIGRGRSSREVAETLSLSVKTIEAHRQRIKRKLGLKSGTQLVNFAVAWVARH